jgi:hypothetical protein
MKGPIMPIGKCLLCHQKKELQDSHFIGKAVSALTQADDGFICTNAYV